MKKFIVMLLAGAFLFTTVGCKKSETKPAEKKAGTEEKK